MSLRSDQRCPCTSLQHVCMWGARAVGQIQMHATWGCGLMGSSGGALRTRSGAGVSVGVGRFGRVCGACLGVDR